MSEVTPKKLHGAVLATAGACRSLRWTRRNATDLFHRLLPVLRAHGKLAALVTQPGVREALVRVELELASGQVSPETAALLEGPLYALAGELEQAAYPRTGSAWGKRGQYLPFRQARSFRREVWGA